MGCSCSALSGAFARDETCDFPFRKPTICATEDFGGLYQHVYIVRHQIALLNAAAPIGRPVSRSEQPVPSTNRHKVAMSATCRQPQHQILNPKHCVMDNHLPCPQFVLSCNGSSMGVFPQILYSPPRPKQDALLRLNRILNHSIYLYPATRRSESITIKQFVARSVQDAFNDPTDKPPNVLCIVIVAFSWCASSRTGGTC